jgi:hypothetical protein
VLARLPVDARARACVVCRAWNAALAERSLWARLDLSPASGVAVEVTKTVLRAAAARAGGQLEALDLSDCDLDDTYRAALAVLTASGASLRELCWHSSNNVVARTLLQSEEVEALLRLVPQLRVFDADFWCGTVAEASRLLRGEALFAPLRVRALTILGEYEETPDAAAVLAFAAAMAGHAGLTELMLDSVPLDTAAALDALVDAALARRLRAVVLWRCDLSPASAPALARLLGGGLARLEIYVRPLNVPAALLLSSALRASTTLTCFELTGDGLWPDPAAAVLLLGALTGHRSLRKLNFLYNTAGTRAMRSVAGATFNALVAANAPALRTLSVGRCRLGDVGMGLLLDALPHNTHLRTLECEDNDITEAFARERMLPALQANASLREVTLIGKGDQRRHPAILRELQDMVAARAAAAPQ